MVNVPVLLHDAYPSPELWSTPGVAQYVVQNQISRRASKTQGKTKARKPR